MVKKYFMILAIFYCSIFSHYSYSRILKVAIANFDPPFVVQLSKKEFYGFDIALMSYVCKKINFECQFIPMPRSKLLDEVANGTVDLSISALIVNLKSNSGIEYSLPYLIHHTHIIGLQTKNNGQFDYKMLENNKIGVADPKHIDQLKLIGLEPPKIAVFQQDDQMIDALNNGNIDFAMVDMYTAAYWSNNSSGNIRDYGNPLTLESEVAIAVNKKNIFLQKAINKALVEYRNSEEFIRDFRKYLFRI